jgi:hypothetical protein
MLKTDRDLLAARFEKKRLEWEKARRHGLAYYLFMRCMLPALILTLWALLFRFGGFRVTGAQFLTVFIFSTAISAVFGLWEWHRSEKQRYTIPTNQPGPLSSASPVV